MTTPSPKLMNPNDAAKVLETALAGGKDFTIADAAAKSGLALRDAEAGLHALVRDYRGHLRVTDRGELVFLFPNGFTKPWIVRTKLERAIAATGRVLVGAVRFVVRAWVAIVLIAYAVLFIALLVGLAFARSNDSRGHRGVGFELGYVFFRVVADALFWTFHPFSPLSYYAYDSRAWGGPSRARRRDPNEPRFYEKVNRFFFGPDAPPSDPRELDKRVLAEIRAQKGRIGIADVLRVTGLSRDEADPLMARLMLDYDGTVEVSEAGGIIYRFESVRKTVERAGVDAPRSKPIWAERERLPPLTGNRPGTNVAIAGLNAFNLLVSLWAIGSEMTVRHISLLLQGVPERAIPNTGVPIALGIVPLVFSIALFALPLARAALRPLRARRIARENGRRALLREILDERADGVRDEALRRAWQSATGHEPDSKTITREVVALGGDVDLEGVGDGNGAVRYRFPELEADARALEAEREAASEEEARIGNVVFTSET